MKLTRATDEHIDFFSILRFYIVTEKLLLSAYVENFAHFSHPTSRQKVTIITVKKSLSLCHIFKQFLAMSSSTCSHNTICGE